MADPIEARIKKMIQERKFSTIVRADDFDEVEGYIVAAARKLVLVQVVEKGHIEGYAVVRRRDIIKVRHGAHERFHHHMYLSAGITQEVVRPKKVVLGSWQSFFAWLTEHYQFVTVEGEDEVIDGFVQGRIRKVKERLITMRHLEDSGQYEDMVVDVPYDEITRVSFGNLYLDLLYMYGQ